MKFSALNVDFNVAIFDPPPKLKEAGARERQRKVFPSKWLSIFYCYWLVCMKTVADRHTSHTYELLSGINHR